MEFKPFSTTIGSGVVLNGWTVEHGHREVIVFTHGNGFCSRVYEPMLVLLAQHFDLLMIDLPGHGQSPASEFVGFNQTAEYLHQAVSQSQQIIAGRDVHVVAHSLGGMLSMLTASEYPDTFSSMVLLDPIMFPRSLLFFMRIASRIGLTSYFHPHVKPTLRRRNGWNSKQEAFDYFHKRKIFKHWTDEALMSYVDHALTDASATGQSQESAVVLNCDPQLEARWFGSLPSHFWRSVSKLTLPVSIFMGEDTYPFSLRAGTYADKINDKVSYSVVPGSHCFMQEHPEAAAQYVIDTIAAL